MNAILGTILAQALTLATPTNLPATWFSDSDYPKGPQQRREDGTVTFALFVSAQGKIDKCSVVQSSGVPELDTQACTIMVARPRLRPARDETGAPVQGLYVGRMTWILPGGQSGSRRSYPAWPADINVDVMKLPGGIKEETVSIAVKIDPAGHILICEPPQKSQSSVKLVEVACAQAKAAYDTVPMDAAGMPVTMVRSLRVTFRASQ
ncbi:TonB family protein [Sphingobium sp. YR768]|uniref:TonB family protein n=1 Tax=Sphingobium sp. YR768 TaxID=1884365 RepID=UPI0008D761F7|nr:TonB family protein [Sphingobium sp. YR768]SEQ93305.1 TonB family C-terminal domain-containing protein [Sphingobium sp. YR768]